LRSKFRGGAFQRSIKGLIFARRKLLKMLESLIDISMTIIAIDKTAENRAFFTLRAIGFQNKSDARNTRGAVGIVGGRSRIAVRELGETYSTILETEIMHFVYRYQNLAEQESDAARHATTITPA